MKCPYFENCGGCYYSVSYEEQLNEKRRQLQNIFARDITINPSSVSLGYRHRMDYVFSFNKLGLRQRGNFRQVVDIEHCQLMSDEMNQVLKKIRSLLKKYKIEPYDYLKHSGYLRYVVLREAKFSGELMVGFVTSNDNDEIIKVINELQADCICWLVNDTKADSSYGKVLKVWGKELEEDFDGVKLKISQNVFFQPNPVVAKEMIQKIRNDTEGRVLDLYCGVGAISLYCADSASDVVGVESVPESVRCAKDNAKLNKIDANFVCEDVSKYLNMPIGVDTIIADPPRRGLGRKVCRKILWKKPARIILISCNPLSLKKDLKFLEKKYNIRLLEAYDMFPYTKHIECLCVLERKNFNS
ncbi:MAG: 23S rRNA (uracil(1939)-C(5))-methyltransferase RlmD [Nanoarchaeota archaeon]